MSVVVEIENIANLVKARTLVGAKSDNEVVEIAIEKLIEDCQPIDANVSTSSLDDEYWDDLFSDPPIPSHLIVKAFSDGREDRF